MSNHATIEIIYTILKNCEEYRSDANCEKCTKKGTTRCKDCKWHYIPQEKGGRIMWGVNYLLGQILRQIDVSNERKHLSVGAINKWEELGLKETDIWEYNYQDWVSCNLSKKVVIEEYIGSSSKPKEPKTELIGNCGFKFRNVFHDEHIVPIHDILETLFMIPKDQLTHEIISEYLDKIHICRMLKSEDRNIHPKYNRGCDLDFERIYDEIYKKCGVTILDFENKS